LHGCEEPGGDSSYSELFEAPNYRPSIQVDQVNHPPHYTQVPGIEAIQVTQHFNFNLGNAIKYVWRCDEKGRPIEDLEKAIWYINKEIERRGADGFIQRVEIQEDE
jgi:hypothetical protein